MCKKLLLVTSLIILFAPVSAGASSITASAVEPMVNAERQNSGLSALSHNSILAQAAQAKADDMARYGYFSHTSPDGKQFQYWVEAAGYKYANAGENLAIHTVDDAEAIISSWMKSPGHRANIVSNKFTETGIGVAYGTYQGQPTVFVAQIFGSPRQATVQREEKAEVSTKTVANVQAAPVKPATSLPRVAGTTTASEPADISSALSPEAAAASTTIESPVLESVATDEVASPVVKTRSLTFGEFVGSLLSTVSDFFSQVALALVA